MDLERDMTEKLRLDLNKVQSPMADTGMGIGVSNPLKKDETSIGRALSPEK